MLTRQPQVSTARTKRTPRHWQLSVNAHGLRFERRLTSKLPTSPSLLNCAHISRNASGTTIRVFPGYGHRKTTLMGRSRRRKTRYGFVLYLTTSCANNLALQTLQLIPLYAKISPTDPSLSYKLPSASSSFTTPEDEEEFDFDATLTIFTETKALDLSSRFRKDADAYYVEAKRSTVSSIAQIPYWMYGVLVVLGWNEAMTVLFNPLYFAMLLVFGASA